MIHQNCSSQHLICKRSSWKMYCIWKIEYGSPTTIYVITWPRENWSPKVTPFDVLSCYIFCSDLDKASMGKKCPKSLWKCVITYIVAGLPYSVFQIQYIFQPNLLHMRCWDEQLWWIIISLVDYCTLPCQDWVSGHSDLRKDVAIYSLQSSYWCPVLYQFFLVGQMMFQMDYVHDYDSAFYIVLWLSLLLYSFLWHVLTCGVMIWRS